VYTYLQWSINISLYHW